MKVRPPPPECGVQSADGTERVRRRDPRKEGKIVSGLTDGTGLSEQDKSEVGNMVANITMYGVQGAVWNALILLIVFISLVNFVLR